MVTQSQYRLPLDSGASACRPAPTALQGVFVAHSLIILKTFNSEKIHRWADFKESDSVCREDAHFSKICRIIGALQHSPRKEREQEKTVPNLGQQVNSPLMCSTESKGQLMGYN